MRWRPRNLSVHRFTCRWMHRVVRVRSLSTAKPSTSQHVRINDNGDLSAPTRRFRSKSRPERSDAHTGGAESIATAPSINLSHVSRLR